MSSNNLKEGYISFFDENKKITHIYPEKGRKHLLENCWCSPVTSESGSVITHRNSKQNPKTCS